MYDLGMNKRTAIKKAGSAYRLAKMLGISRQAVSKWPSVLPPLRVYQLQDKYPELFGVKK